MAERRYKAFISYSHRDKRVANWLHHALETYRLPNGGGESKDRYGLRPIFKDRDELPAADNLGEAIEQAIRASDALIVLCSPSAAQSPWIAREIDLYKRLNGDRGIFPVIVDGEPPENFPPPLLVHYENGEPTEAQSEPIAADLRPEGDGRKLAKLKLIAGLANLDLDSLVQRDAARRQKKLAIVAAASLVGMVGTSGLALYAVDQRNEARDQRAEADGLIEYMLTDLRKQLEPVGRLEVLDGVGKRAMDYYARQKLADLSDDELGRRSRATMLVAEVAMARGDNQSALPAFRQAARTTQAILDRNPNDPQAMFNHGQSLFWVGYIAWQHGDLDAARQGMEGYSEISRRLAAKDRSNFDWQMEESYSYTNLAQLNHDEGNYAKALAFAKKGAAINDQVSEAEGRDDARQLELADALSFVHSLQRRVKDVESSRGTVERELAIYADVLARDPQNQVARRSMGNARSRHAAVLSTLGRHEESLSEYDNAISLLEEVHENEPDDTETADFLVIALRGKASELWRGSQGPKATEAFDKADRLLAATQRKNPEERTRNLVWRAEMDLIRFLTDRSLVPASDRLATARMWQARLQSERDTDQTALVLSHFVAAQALSDLNGATERTKEFRQLLAGIPADPANMRSDNAIALAALAAKLSGRTQIAKNYGSFLDERGLDPALDDRLN
ncbi:TIR domain-containing protein [Erythrobacter aquimaris]|uniref:TIR domain-containing protein n=1 Tax=Qipengyuania aquimaris TaxID=255984 RepID=A0A6I4TN61_9SPHN|nr:TIR domain-containing protein [Qipengyuania aquimaris]MXO96719.1 TIR domain-containing protein [Qipengyuania aquimaris]